MKLTKYMHSCMVLEKGDHSIVVDPGNFSDDFEVPAGVLAVIVTHQHADHCDPEKLRAIVGANPAAKVYALAEVAQVADMAVTPVLPGQTLDIGEFSLEFVGGEHATIHPDMEHVGNIGVVVNHDLFYYPGDSLTPPPRRMQYVALPISAPWLKLSEAIDFANHAAPGVVFPVHDAILSAKGRSLVDRVTSHLLKSTISYNRIEISETIEL